MNNIISRLVRLGAFLFIVFVCQLNGKGQTKNVSIKLLAHKPHLKIKYVPFSKVVVLDNRIDTSKIYNFETGQYPATSLAFDQPASLAVKNYIENAISPIKKGDRTLLINIKELYIPNNGRSIKTNRRRIFSKDTGYYYSRDYIRFFADVYLQSGYNSYKKLVFLRLIYFMRPIANIDGSEIRFLLNELITCASLPNSGFPPSNEPAPRKKSYWTKDTVSFDFSIDTTDLTIAEINVPAKERWSKAPILMSTVLKDGIFKSFEDFQKSQVSTDTFSIVFNEKDSLYKMNPDDSARLLNSGFPWAICVSNNLYIQLGKNIFLKLYRKNNSIEFYIPLTLPDMYTLLSLKEIHKSNRINTASTGNILVDFASIITTGVIEKLNSSSTERKIKQKSTTYNYRNCVVDIESGDILY